MDSQTAQKLAQMSRDVLCHSYSPYSSFPVGAALLCEDGSIYTGVNIETATLLGLCAERCAYVKALSEGHRKFKAVAVSSNLTGACPPCGTCRQFMAEFGSDLTIIMVHKDLSYELETLSNLLPRSFTPDTLNSYTKQNGAH
ncbi:PREDICTED: cytidine deaminase-like [Rhagoletis zephyria]|uniref:cytidine deaminase-like n=1 Tax=Rhagoletis zephyria TaxID=28612 RepID=UPI0008118432|nr:PREDICTED: cytidine deaminase-like [Rhagoletis zephyria]KAH9409593.1 hypothetical protein TYRP_010603 [Tyrophagus putrescentiae]